jgi:hypothetical protein
MLILAGCGDGPSEAAPKVARGPTVTAARAAIAADRALIHTIVQETVRDGKQNAPKWFGDRKGRTTASTCDGITRLIAKHMVTYDDAKQRHRSNDDRLAAAARIVEAVGCGRPKQMSMFRTPVLATTMNAVAAPDEADDWLAVNWHPSSWSNSVQSFIDNGGGSIEPYTPGMTDFEVANLETVYCSQSYTVSELGGVVDEDGEDPMMMYYWPAWAKAALVGCGASVIGNIPEIAEGVHLGMAGGPGMAVAVGVAVAAEMCLYGAIAGYYVWAM